jgi:hypothetical protein
MSMLRHGLLVPFCRHRQLITSNDNSHVTCVSSAPRRPCPSYSLVPHLEGQQSDPLHHDIQYISQFNPPCYVQGTSRSRSYLLAYLRPRSCSLLDIRFILAVCLASCRTRVRFGSQILAERMVGEANRSCYHDGKCSLFVSKSIPKFIVLG